MKQAKEDTEAILKEIIDIQNYFGFKTTKLCEIMNITHGCFRNNLSQNCHTNFFKAKDLDKLKIGITKLYENNKLNINQ